MTHTRPTLRAFRAILATTLVAGGLVVVTAAPASASTLAVPGTYATIGAAVAAAGPGDVINVAAGTYTENVTVPTSIVLQGAGTGTTTIVGRLTLSAPSTVHDFTLRSSDVTAPRTDDDPLWITSGGAGSYVEGNVLDGGMHGIYMHQVVGTSASPTTIENNTFTDSGYGNTGALWAFESQYLQVYDNTFTNPLPADGVGVNLGCGTSHVVVEGNSFANYGNSLVLISNDACATSTDIEITENHSENTSGSSFFFGGNNITQLLIAGNEIVGSGGGNASGIRFSGDWLATPGVPLDDILIQDNDISGASFGVNVGLGVQLADDSSIVSRGNRYSNLVNFAINNLTTVDIHSRDDDLDLTDLELANVSTFVVLDLPTQAEPAAADPELAATGANDDAFMIGAAALSTLLLGLALALLAARRRAVLRAE